MGALWIRNSKGHSKGQRELRAQINGRGRRNPVASGARSDCIRQPYAVILGDPGSGKSTFLKYYLVGVLLEGRRGLYRFLSHCAHWPAGSGKHNCRITGSKNRRLLIDHLIQAAIAEHRRYVESKGLKMPSNRQSAPGQCVLGFDGLD